jgi:predicted dehydrogenase
MSTAQPLQQAWPLPQKPLPIAIIGAGGIVNDAHMPAYHKAGFQVIGIFDNDTQRAQLTAERWKIARVCTSLEELIAAAVAQEAIFDVAIPPAATLSLLDRLPPGAAVLIQKPMGINLEQAHAIVDCCRRRKLVAAINHQLRFAPYMLAVSDAYRRGWLGTLTDVEVLLNICDPWHLFPFLEQLERVEIQLHSIHYLDLIR